MGYELHPSPRANVRAGSYANRGIVLSTFLAVLLLVGCQSVGPKTIPRDRYDYSTAIGESWKRQTLLNIVRLRYSDPPIFVDVGQVVAGYSLETVVSVAGVVSSADAVQGNSGSLGAQGRFTDRPTITYTPLTGNRFIQNIATPITAVAIFEALESGFPAHAMLMIGVSSINGLRNTEFDLDGSSAADPRFIEVARLLGEAQKRGIFGIRVRPDPSGERTMVVTLRHPQPTDELRAAAHRVRELLGLDPDATEFELVAGEFAASPKQIAVRGRSLLRVLQLMALFVDVPEDDMAEGRATRGLPPEAPGPGFHVKIADDEPTDAFVTVNYRGRYYYIDDRDMRSKRALSFIMVLFAMADRSEEAAKPVLTIPAQ